MIESEIRRALRRQGFQVIPARDGVLGVRSGALTETRVEVVPALGPVPGWWLTNGWQAGSQGSGDLILWASIASDDANHLRTWCRAVFGLH